MCAVVHLAHQERAKSIFVPTEQNQQNNKTHARAADEIKGSRQLAYFLHMLLNRWLPVVVVPCRSGLFLRFGLFSEVFPFCWVCGFGFVTVQLKLTLVQAGYVHFIPVRARDLALQVQRAKCITRADGSYPNCETLLTGQSQSHKLVLTQLSIAL